MALQTMDLPRFTGFAPAHWICQAELFFLQYCISDDSMRFSYVMAAFDDEPFYWFNSWFRNDFLTWSDFTAAMLVQFYDSDFIDHGLPVSVSAKSAADVSTSTFRSPSVLSDLSSNLKLNSVVNCSSGSISSFGSSSSVVPVATFLPRSDKKSTDKTKLGLIGDKWALSDDIQDIKRTMGSGTVVGQGVELNMAVGLTLFSLLDLCAMGKAPFDRGKCLIPTSAGINSCFTALVANTVHDRRLGWKGVEFPWKPPWYCLLKEFFRILEHHPFNGTRLKFSAMLNLWVVHGQPRPPEDATKPISTLDLDFGVC